MRKNRSQQHFVQLFHRLCVVYVPLTQTHTQVGPHAVNLAGGQAASMRIAKDIMRRWQQDNSEASELSGVKSKTEEYIQQMQGLLWL